MFHSGRSFLVPKTISFLGSAPNAVIMWRYWAGKFGWRNNAFIMEGRRKKIDVKKVEGRRKKEEGRRTPP
jgi:hypothetical protein